MKLKQSALDNYSKIKGKRLFNSETINNYSSILERLKFEKELRLKLTEEILTLHTEIREKNAELKKAEKPQNL